MSDKETIRTRIWKEIPEPDNPFAASVCYCHGYDVFGDVLGKASWIEFVYLLFRGERPSEPQRRLLEDLAVAIANPGPRDHSVMAAMNGGVGGSHAAACLMAALGVGAGQLGGAREVSLSLQLWEECGTNMDAWSRRLSHASVYERADVWADMEHPAGFDPHASSCPKTVIQLLTHLSKVSDGPNLNWLNKNRMELEGIAGCPLGLTGVSAAALHDAGFSHDCGEMMYLILRLPGAAAHALEQRKQGIKSFPFFMNSIRLVEDPGPYQGDLNDRA